MIAKKKGLALCFFISIIFLSIVYNSAFFHPNRYFFTSNRDGIKNYYNYAWHIKNDSSFFQLTGMSYPYGETLLMEDSLPFFSNSLKIITYIFPSANNNLIGILNFMLLFSLVIGSLFTYLILLRFSIPPLLSAISANAVCIMSSQFLLLNPAGHWGLSFICFFPIGWYLLIRFFENKNQIRWSFLIAINILIWTYTHVYLGFILLFFTLLVHLFKGIFEFKSYIKKPLNFLYFCIQILLPVFLIFSLILMTDNHPDRIDMPFFTDYTASFYSVFTPFISPFKPLYNFFFDLSIQKKQPWCQIGNYIGLTSNIAIIIFFALSIYYFLNKKKNKILNFLPSGMLLYIIASLVLLLYSMAIPIKYLPHSFINMFPLIKQFSALGRFAWAFYYVITVFSIVFFHKLLYKKLWGKILVFAMVLLYVLEGSSYHLKESKDIIKSKNDFNKNYLTEEQNSLLNKIDKNNFQAILPIPYYFKFNLPFAGSRSDSSIYSSMIASYHSGLPIISTYLSRPSVSESMNIFKQMMPYPYRIMIPQVVADGRNIAVIVHVADSNLLNENEKVILKKCSVLLKTKHYTIYNLTIDSLLKSGKNENYKRYKQIEKTLISHNGVMVKDTNQFVLYNNFDSLKSSLNYKGAGSFHGIKKDYNLICKISAEKMDTTKEYVVNFWYYNHIWDQTFNTAIITETDSNGVNLQYLYYSPIKANIIDDWWYLSEYKFKIKSTKSTLSIFFHGGNYFKKWFAIDELLIRPVDMDVYELANNNESKTIYLNNKKYIVSSKKLK